MSKERRDLSQRKIRRIKRTDEETSFEMDTTSIGTRMKGLSPNTKLYYTKVGFGIGTGIFSGIPPMKKDMGSTGNIHNFIRCPIPGGYGKSAGIKPTRDAGYVYFIIQKRILERVTS